MRDAIDLNELARRESEQVEWKENVADVDDVVATLSAFANDLQNLGGGYVVCGAAEVEDEHGFPKMLRTGLTAARAKEVEGRVLAVCRDRVAPPMFPLVDELPSDTPDRRILVFTMPSTPKAHAFPHRSRGQAYYVRIGRTTQEARNGAYLQLLARKNEVEAWDRQICPRATTDDISLVALRDAMVRMRFKDERPVESFLSDSQRLHALLPPLCEREPLTGILRPRNFAVLLFGNEPTRFIPGAYAYFSRYPGTHRGTDYAERHELTGSLFEQITELARLTTNEATLLMDKTRLQKQNVDRYPPRALKEALGNAMAHRDYRLHDPTRVTSFADRMEFHSPGGLPLGVSRDDLLQGNVPPIWRNQTLAWVFMRLDLAQGEGQGLRLMRELMQHAGSPPPRFEISEVFVTCTLFAHPLSPVVRDANTRKSSSARAPRTKPAEPASKPKKRPKTPPPQAKRAKKGSRG